MTTITFSPEVELLVAANLGIELRQSTEESLKDVPSCNSCKVGSINLCCVDDRVDASSIGQSCVLKRTSDRVQRALFFLLITETNTEWLGQEQHVRYLIPTVGIDLGGKIGGNVARTKFLEQANERVASRTSVEPQCDGVLCRVVSRLEEPEESVHIRSKINVTRV